MATVGAAGLGLVGGGMARAGADTRPASGIPDHVFFIMMENHGYGQILGNTADAPYINGLADRYNVATNFHGVTHPSLPNYLATLSGDYQGIFDDCRAGANVTCAPEEFVPNSGDSTSQASLTQAEYQAAATTPHWFPGRNLVDQLENNGRSWKAYMQSMPSPGSTVEYAPVINGTTVKLYAQKHNPFMYFSDVAGNPARTSRIVPFENNFSRDLAGGDVADFVWISPDQCHDMHGISPSGAQLIGLPSCGYPSSGLDHGAIQLGDRFLHDTITAITQSSTWRTSNSTIVIDWDENDYSGFSGGPGSPVGANGVRLGGGDAPLIIVNSQAGPHKTSDIPADHYTVLSTIERLWHLGCLANTCDPTTSGTLANLFAN